LHRGLPTEAPYPMAHNKQVPRDPCESGKLLRKKLKDWGRDDWVQVDQRTVRSRVGFSGLTPRELRSIGAVCRRAKSRKGALPPSNQLRNPRMEDREVSVEKLRRQHVTDRTYLLRKSGLSSNRRVSTHCHSTLPKSSCAPFSSAVLAHGLADNVFQPRKRIHPPPHHRCRPRASSASTSG